MAAPPTRAELDAALAFIAATTPSAAVLRAGIGEAYAGVEVGQRVIYLSAKCRAALCEGDRYDTWQVTLRDGRPVAAVCFSSRACAAR